MYAPRFCLRSLESMGPEGRDLVLTRLFEALIAANIAYLRITPFAPRLYEAGIVYQAEPFGEDDWQDIPETLHRGFGDCEDLACYRIAELRERAGEHALPFLTWSERPGHLLYHVAVRRADGTLEDPSHRLART